MGKEKRREERYKIDANGEVKYGNATARVKVIDISKSGIGIQSSSLIEPGTDVEILLLLKEPKRVSGEVKWALAEPGPAGIVYKIGIFCQSGELVKDDKREKVEV